MRNQTNLTALATDEFKASLVPTLELQACRKAHDDMRAKPAEMPWPEWDAKTNALMSACVEAAKRQYYPLVKRMVIAVLKDWKLTSEEVNKGNPQYLMDGTLTSKAIYPWVSPMIRTAVVNQASYLNVLNVIQPAIRAALKELEAVGLVEVARPRHSKWGAVSTYRWVLPGIYDESLVRREEAWDKCEKCGKNTRLTIDVMGRRAAWCGCGN